MTIPITQFTGDYEPLGKVVTLDTNQSQAVNVQGGSVFTSVIPGTVSGSQSSTNTAEAIYGSYLASQINSCCTYVCNATTNNVKAQIYGSVDSTNFYAIGTLTTVVVGTPSVLTVAAGGFGAYRLYIESATAGDSGLLVYAGFCM